MNTRENVIRAFEQTFGHTPAFVARAPGRVNLLGEHVDYNDGFVLPTAIDRATYLAFSPAESDQTTLHALDFAEQASFHAENAAAKTAPDGSPLPEWAGYPAGMAWALTNAGFRAPAMKAVFSSNVPRGSGLSSSASVEMGFGVAWQALGGWKISPMSMARLGQKAENEYVGVHCGIMDQFASACGRADHLLLLDCRSLEWQELPLPAGAAIVVADTTIRRKLTSGGYNERRAACEEAARIFGVQALRDLSITEFNSKSGQLSSVVEQRARHVVEEVERTRRAIPLLQAGDLSAFGALMNECHTSLRNLYEVSCPELDCMVQVAQSLPGCYGARLTGAGFGGCTVNLVAQEAAPAFAERLAAGYQQQTGLTPEIYICKASDGAIAEPF